MAGTDISSETVASWRLPEAATPRGVRNHNERLVLSTIRVHGPLASSEVARRTGLSAQTASVITRALETEGLLRRGEPVRGKVGKPSRPLGLNPDGAFSFGLRIGRRGTDVVLMDFGGQIRGRHSLDYPYPTPAVLTAFIAEGVRSLTAQLPPAARARIAGIGIGSPFQLWNWLDLVNAPQEDMLAWKGVDLGTEVHRLTGLPVRMGNDATLACYGEQVFGQNLEKGDYAYFYVGAFIGGGVVLGGRVLEGRTGNAGAFGSIVMGDPSATGNQLIHSASLFVLDRMLAEAGLTRPDLTDPPVAWVGIEPVLTSWLVLTAEALASAAITVTAVLDIPTVIIDGFLPDFITPRLVRMTKQAMERFNTLGIQPPAIEVGALGPMAGAMGAADMLLATQYHVNGLSPAGPA